MSASRTNQNFFVLGLRASYSWIAVRFGARRMADDVLPAPCQMPKSPPSGPVRQMRLQSCRQHNRRLPRMRVGKMKNPRENLPTKLPARFVPSERKLRNLRTLTGILAATTLVLAGILFVAIQAKLSLGGWAYIVVYGQIVVGTLTVMSLLNYRDLRRRFLRYRPNHCRSCQYDLTGNQSGVCPECGTELQFGGQS